MAKSVAKNAIYSGIRTVSTMLFPLVTYPYVTRVLLADNLGKVDFSISLVSYFVLIAGLGISNYATREGARVRNDSAALDRFASEVFTINMASTLVSYALLIVLLAVWPLLHGYATLIALQSITILGTTIGVEWLYTLSEDFGYITARTLVMQIASAVLLFLLVKTSDDYLVYAAITVFSAVGANVFNWLRSRRYATIRIVWGFDVRHHLLPMLVLFGNALAVSIYINIDVTLLGVLRSDYEVGLYSVSVKIYKLVKQLLNAIVMVSIPRLSLYLGNGDEQHYHGLLCSVLHALLITVLPAILLLCLLSNYVVLIVGGESFLPAARSLRFLCLALAPAVFAAFAVNSVLLPNRAEKLILRSTVVGAISNLLLNLLAIPQLGASGAALTTGVAEFLVFAAAVWYGRDFCDYRTLVNSQRSALVTVTLGLFLMTGVHMTVHRILGTSLLSFFATGLLATAIYSLVLVIRKDPLALRAATKLRNIIPISPASPRNPHG